MAYNDDEPTAPTSTGPATARPMGITGLPARQVQLTKYHNPVASLAPNDQEVLLELKGSSSTERAGLDLIAVIDVSGSMSGDGLSKVKAALHFVIRKLSDLDRLCIVTFSKYATRVCPLRFVTDDLRVGLRTLVDGLVASGLTNIKAGLETGLGVIDGRRLTAGRAVNVKLMSDGEQNEGGDARDVDLKNVPVYTFGFGAGHNPNLMEAIVRKSLGGTINYVADGANLTGPFSQLLGGLLTIIAQDVQLTVTRASTPAGDGSSITVTFGTLYSAEVRRVIVYLALDDKTGSRPYDAKVLMAQYRFTFQAQQVNSNPDVITIHRRWSAPAPDAARRAQVETELARRQHAELIRAARARAEANDMENARRKLKEAQKALEDNPDLQAAVNPTAGMLMEELRQLRALMEKGLYDKQGHPYAASSLASHEHDRQRAATRGKADGGVGLFNTPRMETYIEQAKQFDNNPQARCHFPEPEVVEVPPPVPAEPEVPPEVPRDMVAGDRRTLSVVLRVATAVLCLVAFVLMASGSARASADDSYGHYDQYSP
uniref:VWFA domain-containing protein n=1 Tax=Leersia perrieri TaxID=77586 RepID=A0A0D9V3D9_9ORYZ